jgi:HAMP domain-containing protein
MLMLISCGVLVLAAVAFVTWDFYRFRADMESDLRTQAQLVLENTVAAVEFSDPVAAGETLEMLEIHPHTQSPASIFLTARCSPSAASAPRSTCVPAARVAGVRMGPNRMFVTEQLSRARTPGAQLTHRRRSRCASRADPYPGHRGRRHRRRRPSDLLAAIVRAPTHRRGPIAELAATARSIADRGDYSIRATRSTRDEIGVLVQAFNRMLDEIQRRSASAARCSIASRKPIASRTNSSPPCRTSCGRRSTRLSDGSTCCGAASCPRTSGSTRSSASIAMRHAQARLVQDLLDVSRITSGKLLLDVRDMDLSSVADNAIDACRPAADARHVSLVTQFAARSRQWAIRIGCSRCYGT